MVLLSLSAISEKFLRNTYTNTGNNKRHRRKTETDEETVFVPQIKVIDHLRSITVPSS